MMLSIMVVGAGATFIDQSDIDALHQDAVDMCVALKIIDGFEDGSFKPTDNVTREQMAKMICVLDNGGKDPQGATGNTFTDVPADRWSNKYVESCAARGVVSGVGDNKFDPASDVTPTQAAKMLLVELGYKADIANYEGDQWATYVNIDATKKGYYEDLEDIDTTAPMSREHAAQMIWNALQAVEVEYTNVLVTDENGNLVSKVDVQDKAIQGSANAGQGLTLLMDKYGYDTKLALVTDVAYDEDDDVYTTYLQYIDDEYTIPQRLTSAGNDNFDGSTDYSDLFMMAVTVVLDKDDEIVAIARDKSEVLAEAIVNDLDENDDGNNKLKIGDTEYKLENDLKDTGVVSYANLHVEETYGEMPIYWNISLIDVDGNGKGDYFIVYPTYVGQISYAGAKSVTIDGQSYKFDDNDIYDGADEDNYVLIVKGVNTLANTYTAGEDAVITQLAVDTISVTGVKAGKSVQADGAWIDLALFNGSEVDKNGFKSGNDYDVACVNGIIVAAEETESTSKDILFIAAVDKFDTPLGDTEGTVDVKAYFTDGSKDIITVNKLDGKKLTSANGISAGALYTYSSSGGQYNIKPVSDNNLAGYDTFGSGKDYAEKDGKLAGNRIADEAVIFVAEKQQGTEGVTYKVDVVSGDKLKDCADTKGDVDYLLGKTSGINYVQVGTLLCDQSPVSTSDTLYAYVIDDVYETQIKDGDDDVEVWAIPVWNGEKNDELYSRTDPDISKGSAISYVIEDDLYADDIAEAEMVAITGFEAKDEGDVVVYAQGADAKVSYNLVMDEDVVFVGISSDDYDNCAAITMSNVKITKFDDNNGVYPNAYIVVDGELADGAKIVAIFYDINNEIVNEEGGDAIYWK